MVVFGKSGCIRAKVVEFGQSCCILANVFVFWKKWLYSVKVVVFGKKWFNQAKLLYSRSGCVRQLRLYSGKWLCSGKCGCTRVKLLY